MVKKEKYKYLAKNMILFTVSSFGSKMLTFLLVPLYTSILSTTDYGTVDIITTTATLLIYVFTLCIADSVLRFAIERNECADGILAYGLRVLLQGGALLGVILSICWEFSFINWADYCYVFLFLSFLFSACSQILTNYLRAVDDIKSVAISGVVTTITTVLSNIILLLILRIGILGYLISMVLGALSASLYCAIKIRFSFKKHLMNVCHRKTQQAMRDYGIPLIFNGSAWWANASLDRYFVTAICGIAENGIYSVANKIPTILMIFQNIFAQAWNLSAIKEFDKEDKNGFFGNTYAVYNAGLVLVCSGLILLNIPIAKILFAKDFFAAWHYSSVLLISIVFSALGSFVGSVFTAVKDSKIFAVSTVIAALVNTVLNAIMIPVWGAQGAAIATAISFFIIWLVRLICARKYIAWKLNLKVDLLAYALLVLQVVLEHMEGHMYVWQSCITVVLLLMYRKPFIRTARLVLDKGMAKIKR